jgi:hypothetical protein
LLRTLWRIVFPLQASSKTFLGLLVSLIFVVLNSCQFSTS